MREIKFRVWDERSEKMRKVHAISFDDLPSIYAESLGDADGPSVCLMQSYSLMQYTGLKDKGGREIYEGDLVQIMDEIKEVKADPNLYNAWNPFVHTGWFGGKHVILTVFPGSCEVIGNIHENPDLLK